MNTLIYVIISVRFSFKAAPYFQLKNFFSFVFSFFFLFPFDKFIHGKILPLKPLLPTPPPPQRKKVPLKTSVLLPINITICKQWSKFVT